MTVTMSMVSVFSSELHSKSLPSDSSTISVLSKKQIPIYTLGYPKGLAYCVNKNKKLINYEDIIQIKKLGNKKNYLPITDRISRQLLRLPLHNNMSLNDVKIVSEKIKKFYKK